MTSLPSTAPTSNPLVSPTEGAAPRTLSIISIVLAAASVVLGHTFILPIAAIVLGFIARSREPQGRTLSTIGIIAGFVILFWWVAVVAFGIAVFVPLAIFHHLHGF